VDISTEVIGLENTRKHIVRGAIDIEELKAYMKEVYSSTDTGGSMNVLWDLRDADFGPLSIEAVQSFMDFISQYWGAEGNSKAAMVVTYDMDYHMSRTYQAMLARAMGTSVEIFKDMASAEEWIRSEP
jgi:stage II sporulation SpoAA-like protein